MNPFPKHNYQGLNTAYDITFGPGVRFFFFNSLIEKAKYNDKANSILQKANSIIQMNGENSSINEQSFLNSTIAAIQFLKNMADFELQNEVKLFNTKIAPLLSDKYSEFKDCYSENKVDYIRFMALLKKLEDDNAEAFLALQDMGLVMKKYNEATQQYINQYEDLTQLKQHKMETTINTKKIYNKTSKIADEMGSTLDNYDDENQNSITTQKGYNFIKENIISMLLSNNTEKELSSDQLMALKSNLFSKLQQLSIKLIDTKEQEEKEIISDLENFLSEIQEDEKKREAVIQKLTDYGEKVLSQGDILQTQGELLKKKLNDITPILDRNKTSKGLTVDVRKKLSKILKNKNLEEYNAPTIEIDGKKKLQFNINTSTGYNKYMEALKEALNMNDSTEEELLNKVEQILKNASKRKAILTLQSESKSATFLSWVLGAISANLNGYLNEKNDATFYTFGKAFLKKEEITQEEKAQINKILKEGEQVYNKLYKISMTNMGKKAQSFDVKTQTELQDIVEEYNLANIRQILSKQQNDINNVKDLFQIDSSVKFAETFTDREGFAGGSLGANVEEQINNINAMLDYGGISKIDADWLMTAVLNAGNGMIGSHQRSALENYFSTVASMLMFRTGGNAIKQWADQGGEYYNNTTTKIHIYTFQTYYVPESYILYKTYEGLNNCINLLQSSASNYGSQAFIYNPVTDSDEIQKSYNINGHTLLQPDWTATSNENYSKVKIEMALLGGFLDLQDEILAELNRFLN